MSEAPTMDAEWRAHQNNPDARVWCSCEREERANRDCPCWHKMQAGGKDED